tara:strand:- start:63 stop:272 length:210 start_codon:yes stop_codon:yes gene_type:complete
VQLKTAQKGWRITGVNYNKIELIWNMGTCTRHSPRFCGAQRLGNMTQQFDERPRDELGQVMLPKGTLLS